MTPPTIDPTSTKHYGSGVIFSHLHRLVAAWVLCGTNRPSRERKIIKVFGSKRRRTIVMKHPERISVEEVQSLAKVLGRTTELIMKITTNSYAPEFTLRLPNELDPQTTQTHVPIHTNANPAPH